MSTPPPPPPPYGQQPYGQPQPQPQPQGQPPKPGKPAFFKRKWVWAAGVIIVIIIIASAASSGGKKKKDDQASNQQPTTSTPAAAQTSAAGSSAPAKSTAPGSAKPSQGFGSQDASGDVKIGKLQRKDDGFGNTSYSVPVTITNHSSKRSDYAITIALESADGKTQIDTADLFDQNIEPGQSKSDSGDFIQATLDGNKVPSNAKLVVQEIQRTVSY